MIRKLLSILTVALVLCIGTVLADEISCTLTHVDPDYKTITVTVDGKETTYDVADNAKLPARGAKAKGAGGGAPPPGNLKNLRTRLEKAGPQGINAKISRDEKTKKVTEVKLLDKAGKGS